MRSCKSCRKSRVFNFFQAQYPLYSLPVSKRDKSAMRLKAGSAVKKLAYGYCADCGLIFSNIAEHENGVIKKTYEKFYHQISPLVSGMAASELDEFLRETDIFFKGGVKRVLEIGCFDAYLLFFLRKKGLDVLGIDPSGYGVKIAGEHGIKVIRAFFPSSKIKKHRFDVIMSRHTIEHVEDPFNFIGEQIKILSAGGIIIFETPDVDWSVANGVSEAFHLQHPVLLTKKFIIGMLDELGFKYICVKELGWRRIIACSFRPHDGLISINKAKEDVKSESPKMKRRLHSFQRAIGARTDVIRRIGSRCRGRKKMAIYGGGSFTGNLLIHEDLSGAKFIVDADSKKWGMEFLHSDIPIIPPDSLLDGCVDALLIFSQFSDEITRWLRKKGLLKKIKHVYRFFPKYEVVRP